MAENLAPCVAVVGPANAGKTTLLHQLDEKLQCVVPSVLVIKGSPDGTGRYLFRAPQLRHDPAWKAEVKGQWGDATIERICEWIDHGRRNLALALLDFGGKLDPDNPRMLSRCSHYLVVSRASDPEGAKSWDCVCKESGLERVGWLESIGPDNDPGVRKKEPFEGTFRYDAGPDDRVNDPVIDRLTARIAALARPIASTPYIDLNLGQRWTEAMIATVGGRRDAIVELAKQTGVVVLGGRAPVWAYLAGLRCALEVNPEVRVFFFDPKQPQRLVEIPPKPGPASFPVGVMSVYWDNSDDGTDRLHFEARTSDKILPPEAALNLAGAPGFESSTIPKSVGLYGPLPIWIHGTYARWLRAVGVQAIAVWDAGMGKFVAVWR